VPLKALVVFEVGKRFPETALTRGSSTCILSSWKHDQNQKDYSRMSKFKRFAGWRDRKPVTLLPDKSSSDEVPPAPQIRVDHKTGDLRIRPVVDSGVDDFSKASIDEYKRRRERDMAQWRHWQAKAAKQVHGKGTTVHEYDLQYKDYLNQMLMAGMVDTPRLKEAVAASILENFGGDGLGSIPIPADDTPVPPEQVEEATSSLQEMIDRLSE